MLNLFLGQRGRGFIKYDDFRVIGDSLCDLHHLTLGNRHRTHDPVGVNVDAELFKNRFCVPEHFVFVHNKARDLGIAPQPQIVHDSPLERLIQLLVNHGDTVVQRLLGAGEIDLAAFQINMAAVLAVNAEQAFHQRGFAGAVLAHQRVYGARLDLQADMIQRFYAGKSLCDIRHPEQYGLLHLDSPPFSLACLAVKGSRRYSSGCPF